MKKIFCLSLLILIYTNISAQTFQWVNTGGGKDTDETYSAAFDTSGNVYITGLFSDTALIAGTTYISDGGTDMFSAKYSSSGSNVWVNRGGGFSNSGGHVIAVDNNANVYVAGEFEDTVTIGTATLISSGLSDIFLAKYDNTGMFQWAVKAGGSGKQVASSIRTDAGGNIFMTGHFEDTVTFDTQSVTSAGGKDVYVVKYNSSGAVVWLTHAGGTSDDESRGIAVDNNNVFITGRFAGSATFGTSNLISTAVSNDVFIAQLNPSGVFQWALSAGGSGSDDAYDASVDGAGNCYVAGYFHDTISFGTDTLMSSGNDDAFIAKYNSSGTALWAKRAGGVNGDRAYSVAADVSGKVYITGSFEDTASFNSTNLISNGDKDIFVAEYNSSGVLQWAMRAGGSGFDRGYGITTDQSGNVYTTGVFEQTASFGTLPVISSGLLDFFLTKISAPVGMIELNVEESCIHVYPNPADSKVHVEYKDIANSKVAVYDVTGQKIFEKSNCSLVDLSAFNNGLYFIVLTDMRKNITYSKTELLNK